MPTGSANNTKKGKLPTLTQIKGWMRQLAREHGIPGQVEDTWRHSRVNWSYADAIAKKLIAGGETVDRQFLKIACYLHDIGRMVTGSRSTRALQHPIYHAYEGYRLVRRKGYGEKVARVCIVHMGGSGLSAQINRRHGFQNKDYFPRSIEEKLLAYADARNVWSDAQGSHIGSYSRAYNRFKRYGPGVKRFQAIHHELKEKTDKTLENLIP